MESKRQPLPLESSSNYTDMICQAALKQNKQMLDQALKNMGINAFGSDFAPPVAILGAKGQDGLEAAIFLIQNGAPINGLIYGLAWGGHLDLAIAVIKILPKESVHFAWSCFFDGCARGPRGTEVFSIFEEFKKEYPVDLNDPELKGDVHIQDRNLSKLCEPLEFMALGVGMAGKQSVIDTFLTLVKTIFPKESFRRAFVKTLLNGFIRTHSMTEIQALIIKLKEDKESAQLAFEFELDMISGMAQSGRYTELQNIIETPLEPNQSGFYIIEASDQMGRFGHVESLLEFAKFVQSTQPKILPAYLANSFLELCKYDHKAKAAMFLRTVTAKYAELLPEIIKELPLQGRPTDFYKAYEQAIPIIKEILPNQWKSIVIQLATYFQNMNSAMPKIIGAPRFNKLLETEDVQPVSPISIQTGLPILTPISMPVSCSLETPLLVSQTKSEKEQEIPSSLSGTSEGDKWAKEFQEIREDKERKTDQFDAVFTSASMAASPAPKPDSISEPKAAQSEAAPKSGKKMSKWQFELFKSFYSDKPVPDDEALLEELAEISNKSAQQNIDFMANLNGNHADVEIVSRRFQAMFGPISSSETRTVVTGVGRSTESKLASTTQASLSKVGRHKTQAYSKSAKNSEPLTSSLPNVRKQRGLEPPLLAGLHNVRRSRI